MDERVRYAHTPYLIRDYINHQSNMLRPDLKTPRARNTTNDTIKAIKDPIITPPFQSFNAIDSDAVLA